MKALEEGAKSVAGTFANSMGDALADVIIEGKNMKEAFDSVFKSVLRTAIETFTRIAIEAAILRGSTGGLGTIGGFLAVGSIASGGFKGFKLAEGGIVRRPTIAQVGEAGPEAVIPLDRLGSFGGPVNVTVTQNNTISVQGNSDEQVRTLMRRMSEATRSGAAEGAELVKSILSKQDRFAREAV
jgi:phage-related minor tail protein